MITPESLAASNTEHGHQAAIFCFANQNLNKYPDLRWLFAIPNGFYGVQQKGKMKAEGLKSGLPDIGLMVKRGSYQMLWIELKKPKVGKVSTKQNEWLTQARECGHGSAVCYGWIEARDMIISYLEFK